MSEAKEILVTGISGFIACQTAVQLLNRGYRVRGSVRNLSRTESLKSIIGQHAPTEGLSFVQAELMDGPSWQAAVQGTDGIIHIASPIGTALPKDPNEMIVPAVEGTRNVLQAAIDQGVPRVVLTSSSAAIAYGHENPPAVYTEDHHTNPDHKEATPYIQSKTYAERAAWEMAKEAGDKLQVTTIHPGLVLGPVLEKDYGSSAEVVKKLMDGSFPGVPNLGFPMVDVRDTADLHILALENVAAIGERFVCTNGFLWMPELAEILKKNFPDRKVTTKKLPSWLVKIFALLNKEVKSVLQDLDAYRPHSGEKAQRLLGWNPRSAEEAVVATAQSLINHKII